MASNGDYLDHGYMGDTIINGQQWDLHHLYPPGRALLYPPLIVYVSAFFYRLISLFITIPLLTACYWLPAFIGPLCGIPAYFMVKRITNNYGGLTAGILAVTTPFYFVRTVPGFFDTDMFNVLLPLLILWFLFEAVQSKDIKLKVSFSILSAFSMFVFSMAWNGWTYTFYIIVLTSIIYIIACKIKKIEIRGFYLVFGIFSSISLGLIFIFRGLSDFIYTITLPIQFIGLNTINPWPNINLSVSELSVPSVDVVISLLGPVLLGLGLFGIFLILRMLMDEKMKKRFLDRIDWFTYLLLLIWILISIYAVTNGSRFILLMVPPLVISAGIMVGICVEYLNVLKKRRYLVKVLSMILLVVIIIPALLNASQILEPPEPNLDDDLWAGAQWIHANTSNNTIVISPDWGYNHVYTAIADRPVVGTQDTPREFWIDKAFSTSNQSLSYGIFRMLSTSGDEAYKTLNMSTNSTAKTVEILDKILGVDNDTANEILTKDYNMNKKQAQEVLKYTHPNKTSPYVLVTYDNMLGAGYWTFHFGNWDFKKMKGGNYTYSHGKINMTNNSIKTSDDITMNLKTGKVTWDNKTPYCTILITKGQIKKLYNNKKSNFCIILIMDSKQSVVINKKFENSLFTKLVIEKTNTTFFRSIYKNKKVVVWKPASFH